MHSNSEVFDVAIIQIAPELSQADIRKIIAKYCDSIIVHKPPQPRHEVWVRRTDYQKGLESEIQDRLKPEEVCLYEAMRVHELRLAQMGLKLRNLKTLDSVLVHNAAFKVLFFVRS
jgi:hypothetical protein